MTLPDTRKGMKVNKKSIIRSIHDALSDAPVIGLSSERFLPYLSEEQIKYIIDLFLHIVRKRAIIELVKFKGFGTFGKRKRNSKLCYDFNTKKVIPIEQKEVPFFRPCAGFFGRGNDEV